MLLKDKLSLAYLMNFEKHFISQWACFNIAAILENAGGPNGRSRLINEVLALWSTTLIGKISHAKAQKAKLSSFPLCVLAALRENPFWFRLIQVWDYARPAEGG